MVLNAYIKNEEKYVNGKKNNVRSIQSEFGIVEKEKKMNFWRFSLAHQVVLFVAYRNRWL